MILDPPVEPYVDKWEEYTKPEFIYSLIFDVAEDIAKRGYRTNYKVLYDVIYTHISENIEKYYPQDDLNDEND